MRRNGSTGSRRSARAPEPEGDIIGWGDEVLAAGQAQRLYDIEPGRRKVLICDRHNRPRWHPIWDGNPIIAKTEAEATHRLISAPEARPYIVYPFTPESGWTFNTAFKAREHIAKIYLTIEELTTGLALSLDIGPYVLIEPWSKHPNLRWPLAYWQALVAQRPDLTFVQHIHKDSPHLEGVIRVGADWRHACGLIAAAECYVRGESGLLHAAAALGTPSVAIWGGCMDWDVLGEYPLEVGVGVTPPFCGKWLPCPHCTEIMASISADQVSQGIDAALKKSAL